eukprot:3606146-Rhodomonas_salina.1
MGRASDYGTQQAQYNLLLLQLVTLPVEIPSWIDELTATCDDNLYVAAGTHEDETKTCSRYTYIAMYCLMLYPGAKHSLRAIPAAMPINHAGPGTLYRYPGTTQSKLCQKWHFVLSRARKLPGDKDGQELPSYFAGDPHTEYQLWVTKILRDTRMPVRPSPAPVRSFKLNVKAVGTKISCDDSYPGLAATKVCDLGQSWEMRDERRNPRREEDQDKALLVPPGQVDEEDDCYDYESWLEQSGVSRYSWTVVLVCGVGNAVDAVELMSLSYILPEMKGEFPQWLEVSLSSAVFIGMLLGGLVGGTLCDQVGRRPVLLAAMMMNAIFTVIFGMVDRADILVALRFLTGFGVGS